MNAPENIAMINAAHGVLQRAKDALCVADVARAIGASKPTASKQLKELYDLGIIESKPRKGGTPYYLLIAEPKADMGIPMTEGTPTPVVCDSVQTEGATQTEAPERMLTPEAQAERDQFVAEHGHDGNCSCHISPPCGSCMHPGNPRNQEEDETAWMDAPAEEPSQPLNFATSPELQYLAPEDYVAPPADPELLALANQELHNQLEAKDNELFIQAKVVVDLRERLDALTQQWEADTGRITADLRAALESRSQAINEADRLRLELFEATKATTPAVGYLVRAPKRKPRFITKQEGAQAAALAAVRAGAGRAEVLAVVPVGIARRGAEWQGATSQAKGD